VYESYLDVGLNDLGDKKETLGHLRGRCLVLLFFFFFFFLRRVCLLKVDVEIFTVEVIYYLRFA